MKNINKTINKKYRSAKKTIKNMPIHHKGLIALSIFGTATAIYYARKSNYNKYVEEEIIKTAEKYLNTTDCRNEEAIKYYLIILSIQRNQNFLKTLNSKNKNKIYLLTENWETKCDIRNVKRYVGDYEYLIKRTKKEYDKQLKIIVKETMRRKRDGTLIKVEQDNGQGKSLFNSSAKENMGGVLGAFFGATVMGGVTKSLELLLNSLF